jgi:hypothetical protein
VHGSGVYERASGAAGRPLGIYRRRTPERTVLHELVAQHAKTMVAELRDADPEGGGLPRYVERELAAYLRCGVLAHGFARVRCQACGDEIIVSSRLATPVRHDVGASDGHAGSICHGVIARAANLSTSTRDPSARTQRRSSR